MMNFAKNTISGINSAFVFTTNKIGEGWNHYAPYALTTATISSVAATALSLPTHSLILQSAFFTGAYTFTAFQIGFQFSSWILDGDEHTVFNIFIGSLTAAAAIGCTSMGALTITTLPVITAAAFTALGLLVKSQIPPSFFDEWFPYFLKVGVISELAHMIFTKPELIESFIPFAGFIGGAYSFAAFQIGWHALKDHHPALGLAAAIAATALAAHLTATPLIVALGFALLGDLWKKDSTLLGQICKENMGYGSLSAVIAATSAASFLCMRPQYLILAAPGITAICTLAAVELGFQLFQKDGDAREYSLLTLGSTLAATAAFTYLASLPIITVVAFAALGALAKKFIPQRFADENFRYAVWTGLISLGLVLFFPNIRPQRWIFNSVLDTGAYAFAAFQIGWALPCKDSHPALRLGAAIATTAALSYFTSIPIITSVCFAALGALVKGLHSGSIKKFIENEIGFLAYPS